MRQNLIFGGPYRVRTGDLFHAMEARYQLRQRPWFDLVDLARVELTSPHCERGVLAIVL